jgi:hypothetical protein
MASLPLPQYPIFEFYLNYLASENVQSQVKSDFTM